MNCNKQIHLLFYYIAISLFFTSSKVLFKITLLGATYLAVLAALPIVLANVFNLSSSVQIGGTSLLIVVGVAIETVKQLKTTTQAQEYHGFMAE